MFETILILLFSSALFAYWFRYTVLLLLREESTAKPHGPVMGPLQLAQSREALESGDVPLERLHDAIAKDYRVISYLLGHAAGLGLHPLEQHLLILDYRMMALWYRLTRLAGMGQARQALNEMAVVLTCITHKMVERAESPARG